MSLGERSITAVLWGTGGSVVRMAIQISVQVVLARLLGPGEYGVFAIGSVVVGFSSFFADFGLAYGLIQKREVSDQDVRFAFTWQLVVGAVVTCVIALGSGLIARFFGEPRSADVVQVMSLICLVSALTAPSASILKRRLDFKTQQVCYVISYVLGFVCVGIPLALTGKGVWALVAAWVSQASILCLLLFRTARYPLKPLFWYSEARTQLRYSGTVLATNLLNWAIGNIDRVIVGRLLPSREIGIYATMYNLVYTPSASILGVVQPVFFSASARMNESNADQAAGAKLVKGFAILVAAIFLYLGPVFATAAVIADDLIVALYGHAWRDASKLFAPLTLAMPFFLVWGLSTPVLWASGRPEAEFNTQWPVAILWGLSGWLLTVMGGAQAMAWGVCGLFVLRCAVTMRKVIQVSNLRVIDVWHAARGGFALSIGTAAAAVIVDRSLSAAALAPILCVLGAFAAAFLMAYICLRQVPGLVAPEIGILVHNILGRMPAGIRGHLAWLSGAQGKQYESS